MSLDPGVRLGTYEILGPLGSGGMGEVYRARDRKLGRDVALKILSATFASDPSRVARFEREARMLAAVNHPLIAAIYGAEEDGDFRYIVMELVPGETLAEKLLPGALPVPEALDLAVQIAEALSAAHEAGVIHRDLKPANIKVTPDGRIKILDLGLAKAMAMDSPAEGDLSNSPTVVMDDSRPGNMLGTPGFMSPEQARGKDTDRRADIWAFGCVFFEMLTGQRAFPGDTVPDILLSILDREPDWEALPAAVPERIRQLLRRCLEKDVNRRLRDAGDARLEIEAARSTGESGRGRVARWAVAAAALAGAAAVAGAMLLLQAKAGAAPQVPTRKFIAVLSVNDEAGEPSVQRIGDGFVDTVQKRLSHAPTIQVVPTRSAVPRAGQETDLRRIAREAGANLIVRISFWIQGEGVRTTYRIVNEDGMLYRSGSVDGSLTHVFELADRLADDIARDLELRPIDPRTPTPLGLETPDEWKHYLEAVGLLQRYDRRESVEQALQILKALAAKRPASPLVQAALGTASLAMFDFTKERSWADAAVTAAQEARRLGPGSVEVEVIVGRTLLATGRAKEAVETFRRVLAAKPDDFDALLGLGRSSESAGDDAAAEAAFRKAIELQPSSLAGYNQLGALYSHRGRYREAVELFRQATRATPDSYRAWSNLGGASTNACDFTGALEGFRRALALRPNNAAAVSNLGLTQLWTGRYREAVETLERAAANGPKDFVIWANLGDAYRGARGRAEDAAKAYARSIELAREALKLNPTDAIACSFIATGLAKTGHVDEAGAFSRKALALDDKNPDLLSDAAIVAAIAGRDAEAMEFLQKAVAAGYCPATIARQPEFDRLREAPAFRSIVAAPRSAAGL
jgi:eukaryotic-like serine/threonine-protein kinase